MGINVEALVLARKIGLFNSEAIYYVKNSLTLNTAIIQKQNDDKREKLIIMIKNSHPKVDVDLILANTHNNNNHNLTKIDIDLILDVLVEYDKPIDEVESELSN